MSAHFGRKAFSDVGRARRPDAPGRKHCWSTKREAQPL
jgi:hypothetical protein